MTDMVFAPTFAEIDAEREVVLEEIAMYEDTPQELVHDLFSEAVFGSHQLGRPVIGTREVISAVSRRALAAYHRQMYVGGNVVVAAAGNLQHEEVVRLLERAQRAQAAPPKGLRVRRPLVAAPAPGVRFQRKETEQYHVCVGAPGISRADPRRFAASALDGILGGSASSRLFQEIREKRGLAYNVYTFASMYAETGEVGVYVGTREENLAECLDILAREIGDVAAGGVRDDELRRAKESLKGRIMLSMESTANRANRLGKSVVTDTKLLSLDEVIESLEAVTADDVSSLAAELLPHERLSVAGIGGSERRFRKAVARVSPGLADAVA
jgi:predicted Zn-dependent peptidase